MPPAEEEEEQEQVEVVLRGEELKEWKLIRKIWKVVQCVAVGASTMLIVVGALAPIMICIPGFSERIERKFVGLFYSGCLLLSGILLRLIFDPAAAEKWTEKTAELKDKVPANYLLFSGILSSFLAAVLLAGVFVCKFASGERCRTVQYIPNETLIIVCGSHAVLGIVQIIGSIRASKWVLFVAWLITGFCLFGQTAYIVDELRRFDIKATWSSSVSWPYNNLVHDSVPHIAKRTLLNGTILCLAQVSIATFLALTKIKFNVKEGREDLINGPRLGKITGVCGLILIGISICIAYISEVLLGSVIFTNDDDDFLDHFTAVRLLASAFIAVTGYSAASFFYKATKLRRFIVLIVAPAALVTASLLIDKSLGYRSKLLERSAVIPSNMSLTDLCLHFDSERCFQTLAKEQICDGIDDVNIQNIIFPDTYYYSSGYPGTLHFGKARFSESGLGTLKKLNVALDEAVCYNATLAGLIWSLVSLSATAIPILAFMIISSFITLAIPLIRQLRSKTLNMNHSDSGIITTDFET